jgi:hypothetical protein
MPSPHSCPFQGSIGGPGFNASKGSSQDPAFLDDSRESTNQREPDHFPTYNRPTAGRAIWKCDSPPSRMTAMRAWRKVWDQPVDQLDNWYPAYQREILEQM